jgi:hypothetical protein
VEPDLHVGLAARTREPDDRAPLSVGRLVQHGLPGLATVDADVDVGEVAQRQVALVERQERRLEVGQVVGPRRERRVLRPVLAVTVAVHLGEQPLAAGHVAVPEGVVERPDLLGARQVLDGPAVGHLAGLELLDGSRPGQGITGSRALGEDRQRGVGGLRGRTHLDLLRERRVPGHRRLHHQRVRRRLRQLERVLTGERVGPGDDAARRALH